MVGWRIHLIQGLALAAFFSIVISLNLAPTILIYSLLPDLFKTIGRGSRLFHNPLFAFGLALPMLYFGNVFFYIAVISYLLHLAVDGMPKELGYLR